MAGPHARFAEIARKPDENFESVSRAIATFAGAPKAESVEELLCHLQGLARGKALIKQATMWKNPSAGRVSKLSETRGKQWRLVISVSGLEIMIKSLLGKNHPGIQEFQILEDRIGLDVQPLPASELSKKVREKWIEDKSIMQFLVVRNHDLKILTRFLVNGESGPIEGLARQLALAKAIRNCTVLAALSATKCNELKLKPALEVLPGLIHETSEGIFEVLCRHLQ
ncbi:hypothetical protein OAE72_02615 [Akkermansiaceae bacterium]|nr:hypothetical protein [Akkermansiaceae bacterium]